MKATIRIPGTKEDCIKMARDMIFDMQKEYSLAAYISFKILIDDFNKLTSGEKIILEETDTDNGFLITLDGEYYEEIVYDKEEE